MEDKGRKFSHRYSPYISNFSSEKSTDKEEEDVPCGRSRSRSGKISSLWGDMLHQDTETEQMESYNNSRPDQNSHKISAMWTAMLLQDKETENKQSTTSKNAAVPGGVWSNFGITIDQGNHEVEVGVEAHEASISWDVCTKNPGHVDFIPAPQFNLEHLPEGHRDEDILTYVKLWSNLVVKVIVGHTSWDRPEEYPFYNLRGKKIPRTGTGKVADITLVTDEDTPCPCPECIQSGNRKKMWKAIWIMTALHVVYDDKEVEKTKVEVYFDDADNRSNVRTLHGIRVVDFNVKGDWCKFEVACHDISLAEELEKAEAPLPDLAVTIRNKYLDTVCPPLAIIGSHPHGCAKHISVGEWKDRIDVQNKEDNFEWTEYTYTTATCKGSSGAPVWILGPERAAYVSYYYHVHSEGLTGGINKSGAGDVDKKWDW